jgi:DNA-binding GntR family transcriptional regulator
MTEDDLGTRVGRLAQQIAELVLSGEIAPGLKLDEQSLAQRFQVSRTPVREALRQLANTGLIELFPNRGAFVARVTPEQLEEMFVAMAELEATCARLAAMSMSPVERRGLQRMHEGMGELARRGLVAEFTEANERLHSLIYSGAHNAILAEAATALRRRLALYRRAQFRTEGRLPRSLAEHDEVVKAIVSGDPARAHAAMLHHVDLVEASFEKLLASAAPEVVGEIG